MKNMDLYNAFGVVDEDILERSEAAIGWRKKNGWRKWGTIAACFGLILTAALVTMPGILKRPGGAVPPPSSHVPGPAVSDGNKQPNIDPLQPPDGQNIIINWDHVVVNESKGLAPDYALRYYDPALYDTASWGGGGGQSLLWLGTGPCLYPRWPYWGREYCGRFHGSGESDR